MLSRDYRDILGGLVLVIAGIAFSAYAVMNLDLGSPRSMGPGLFPAALGIIMAVLGALIAAPAAMRTGQAVEIRLAKPALILVSVAAFALTIPALGMVPAIVFVTLISSLADRKAGPIQLLGLCIVLVSAAWLIFRVALNLPIPMLIWPFGV